ncbi:MAG: hypothetical protein ABJA71_05960 [Ginsengibacter sp.]
MKTLTTACVLSILLAITHSSQAQKTDLRPKLFNAVENKIRYPKADLEKIFTKTKGSDFHISLPGNFTFSGTIVSTVQRYNNLESFLIKSDLLNGAMFAISKRINDDNSVTYVGRIVNDKYSDGYELKVDSAGNYFLNKINMKELLQDQK